MIFFNEGFSGLIVLFICPCDIHKSIFDVWYCGRHMSKKLTTIATTVIDYVPSPNIQPTHLEILKIAWNNSLRFDWIPSKTWSIPTTDGIFVQIAILTVVCRNYFYHDTVVL